MANQMIPWNEGVKGVYEDFIEATEGLSDEEKAAVFNAFAASMFYGVPPLTPTE